MISPSRASGERRHHVRHEVARGAIDGVDRIRRQQVGRVRSLISELNTGCLGSRRQHDRRTAVQHRHRPHRTRRENVGVAEVPLAGFSDRDRAWCFLSRGSKRNGLFFDRLADQVVARPQARNESRLLAERVVGFGQADRDFDGAAVVGEAWIVTFAVLALLEPLPTTPLLEVPGERVVEPPRRRADVKQLVRVEIAD